MLALEYIQSRSCKDGAEALSARLTELLLEKRKVLWLICGGSNVPIAIEIMNEVRSRVTFPNLANLTVAQTDERYGAVGHPDSNWTQLLEGGLNIAGIRTVPILVGKSLDATVTDYADRMMPIFKEISNDGGVVIAQFGIGADGHIAGLLPHTTAIQDPRLVSGYKSSPYIRITLTPSGLLKVDEAYAFAFGDNKKEALNNLHNKDLSLEKEPCQILKNIPKVFIYTDVF